MKRSALVIGTMVGVLTWASPASASTQPVVSGTLTDSGGEPSSGLVGLEAWPLTAKPQGVQRPRIIARARAGVGGAFTLAVRMTPALRRMALANRQRRIDFTVRGITGGRVAEHSFTRFLSRDGRLVDPAGTGAGASSAFAGAGTKLVARDRVLAGAQAAGATRVLDECTQNKSDAGTKTAYAPIGELNNAYRDTRASWVYSEGATSSFTLEGTPEVEGVKFVSVESSSKKTDSAKVGTGSVGVYSRRQFGQFEFERVRMSSGCTGVTKYAVRVKRWLGDLDPKKQRNTIRTCNKDQAVNTAKVTGGLFSRSEKSATTWKNGAQVFGVGLNVKSGFSKQIRIDYKWRTSRAHYFCGDGDPPVSSGRVFSGLKRRG